MGYSRGPNGTQEGVISRHVTMPDHPLAILRAMLSATLSPRARESLTVAGLLGLVTFFFLDILLAGLNLYTRDIPLVYYPSVLCCAPILRAGALPLWNHFASGGGPLAANPGYEAFYPLQWLVALGPLRDMFHLEIVLHYLIAALGMYLFGRSLGLQPHCLGVRRLCVGARRADAGPLESSAVPLLRGLAAVGRLHLSPLSDGWQHPAIGGRRASAGHDFSGRDVSMMMQTCALLAAYAIHHARRTGTWRSALAGCVIAGLIAFAIAAVQLIPALDFQRDSGRAVPLSLAVATHWSMPPVTPRGVDLARRVRIGQPRCDFVVGLPAVSIRRKGYPFYFSIYPGIVSVLLVAAGFRRRTAARD